MVASVGCWAAANEHRHGKRTGRPADADPTVRGEGSAAWPARPPPGLGAEGTSDFGADVLRRPLSRPSEAEVLLGFGRIVVLYRRSSTSYQIYLDIRCLYF